MKSLYDLINVSDLKRWGVVELHLHFILGFNVRVGILCEGSYTNFSDKLNPFHTKNKATLLFFNLQIVATEHTNINFRQNCALYRFKYRFERLRFVEFGDLDLNCRN